MIAARSSIAHWFAPPTSLHSYLTRLIVGGLGPILIFSVFMMVLLARQEQANRMRGLGDTTRALALAIDREIESSITNLEALATAEPLDVGAVNVFRAAAARILHTQNNWRSLSLFDPKGARLMRIEKPLVAESNDISRDSLNSVLRTRQPVIGDFSNRNSPESGINIYVPVTREQTLIYILCAVIEPRVFTEILTRQKFPDTWTGTLFDAKRTIIARSRDAEKFMGTPVADLLTTANLLTGDQLVRGVGPDGIAADAAVSRLNRAGWFVALIVPSNEVNAILYRSIATVGGGGLLLLLVGLGVALIFARQVSRSIWDLSVAARDLGRGQAVSFPVSSPIAEIDGLARQMERAAALLRERESERDRVETALRRQEEDLQRQADLLNLANEAIFARQLDSRIIYWNRGAEQLYGYAQNEVIGALSHELLATEFPGSRGNFEASLLTAGEWSGELKQKTKQGRYIDVESRLKLITDRAGGHLILECNRDISPRKQSARRAAAEHAVTVVLAESEMPQAAWPRLLEVVGSGLDWQFGRIWMIDKATQILECVATWSQPALTLSEMETHQPLARGAGLAGRVWAEEKVRWIPDSATASTPMGDSINPHEKWRAALAFPIRMRSEVLGVVEFLSLAPQEPDRDIARMAQAIGDGIGQFIERMRAEEALRRSEEHLRNQAQELEQQLLASGRLVAVGELTASMAHEFNNPLGIVLGFAQGLLSSMDPNDPNYHPVQIIAEEARRCETLVQELLEFGRPKRADFTETDVEQMIQKTLDLVQPRATKNHVETATEIEAPMPPIHADPQQLQQVLLNLSLNAVDAMPKGGTLTVGAVVDPSNEIMITVADTGIGIDADALPRIFQPFFTSKKRRGLGLGLPICDRIIKSHGGRIEVDSKPGRGTRFKIHLPMAAPAEPDVDLAV